MEEITLGVSEFVAVYNQTLETAYPRVTIVGELAQFRVSRNRWVYFDLKDATASVKFFGTVYQLPGPLEEGMLIRVQGQPRLHPLYGFSVNIQTVQPAGEGSIRRAADLLQRKLTQEGLFDPARKRPLPYPPARIGLITSRQSAAYADFVKIIHARWPDIAIQHIDVQVQGEAAPAQIAAAIETCNTLPEPPEVLVLIRGGGSAEDLAAFSTEQVTRAVAASRIPTLVAIGHEVDLSLAELAADQRASTPSNAAELLVPDRGDMIARLRLQRQQLDQLGIQRVRDAQESLVVARAELSTYATQQIAKRRQHIQSQMRLLEAYNPNAILQRGYAVVRQVNGDVVRHAKQLKTGAIVHIQLADSSIAAKIESVKEQS